MIGLGSGIVRGFVSGGGSFLLDQFSGSGAAYSTRRIASSTTVLMRVRRDTAGGTGDDDEADVAFDSNGELSLDSIISNASNGVAATTLGQFINVGTVGGTTYTNPDSLSGTAVCTVTSWYDQSPRGNNLEQASHSSQPIIHDGTSNQDLEKENGKVCLELGTTKKMSVASVSWSDVTARGDAYSVLSFNAFPTGQYEGSVYNMDTNLVQNGLISTSYNGTSVLKALAGQVSHPNPIVSTGTNYLVYHRSGGSYTTGSSLLVAINGGALSTQRSGTRNWSGMNLNADGKADYRINELIVFNPPSDSNRTDIETNINDYYSIY